MPTKRNPLSVRCPYCMAKTNAPCRNMRHGGASKPHPIRAFVASSKV